MFFALSQTVLYRTSLSANSIANCLNEEIEPPQTFRWSFWGNAKKYEGMANSYTFSMHRIPRDKSTYFAQAEGTIRRETSYTIVEVQIEMPILLKIGVFLGLGLAVFCVLLSFGLPPEDEMMFSVRYLPMLMFVMGFVIFFGGYQWQAYNLKHDLKTIMHADIIENQVL